jgi:hypothetical protein
MSMVRTLAMPVALVVVAVAGATAYVVTRPAAPAVAPPATMAVVAAPAPVPAAARTAPEPPPAPAFVAGSGTAPAPAAAPAPPPQAADAMQPPPAAQAAAVPPAPVTTSFAPQPKAYSLVRDSAAYVAATLDSPQMYPLRAGTAVSAVARSTDDKWVIALTETGQAAFLPAADLGPYDPRLAPAPDLPASVSGITRVVDTANLVVNGQPVQLAGITGEGGVYAAELQMMINSQGDEVSCTLQGTAYLCTLRNGLDIARTALYNGGADLANDATDDYRAQAAAARAAHKGIWK